MIVADIFSLSQPSLARDSGLPLWKILTPGEWAEVAIVDALAIFILALTSVRCFEILKFERATESALRQFHDFLFPAGTSAVAQ
jgi:hypothetical protein